jgi:acetylornithine deacetylase/succinyl-diaminopimelate desuccinylase-like protein
MAATALDTATLQASIERRWECDVMPALVEYIAIPCQSPAFDADWAAAGHMDRAIDLMVRWARVQLADVTGVRVEVVRLPTRTPVIFIDIPGDRGGAPVLIYGHLDKQPAMEGWTNGRSAWVPSLEGDRLYGRGGADDGYSIFSAIIAILALRDQNLGYPRCMILIEACEESGSTDLPQYMEHLAGRIGVPAVVFALDAGCGNYDQLWMTTSLRGQVAGTLAVRVLTEGVHSGDAAGVVPSSFRIARHLLSRFEDPATGEVVSLFHAAIPGERRAQAATAASALGSAFHAQLPFAAGTKPVTDELTELVLNRSWRPQLVITGMDGVPGVANAAAVMQPAIALKLSLRLPPTLDPVAAARQLKTLLEADPPYGCEVWFRVDMVSPGWHAPIVAPWLQASLDEASISAFGLPSALIGGGGGIPFLAMLGERFPSAQFVVTGVLGPQSNAHGPNEFLDLPTAKRITAVVAQVLHDAFHQRALLLPGEASCAVSD